MNSAAVCVAGEIFIDLLMTEIDAWPEPGKEVFARDFRREIGGGTAITACALARLGCPAEVLAVVGREMSGWVTERLESCGVDAGLVVIDDVEPTGVTVIASRPEDRAFLTYRGANRNFPSALENWLSSTEDFARHVHLSVPLSFETGEQVFAGIRLRGATASLDVGWNQAWLRDARAWSLARQADIFFPNKVEAEAITGKQQAGAILQAFADGGFRRVVLKLGEEGAAMLWDGATYFAAPVHVKCLDTTGAGDCFDAGFLGGWLAGRDPLDCLCRANICGALSTEAYGGIAGAPSGERVEEELRRMKQ